MSSAYRTSSTRLPIRPNSSENTAKMKSVCALGDELEVRLRAVQPALAGEAARAHGDGRLDDVVARAERVGASGRAASGCAAAGSRAARTTADGRLATPAAPAAPRTLPAEAGEEDHVEPAAPTSTAVPRSGWRAIRPTGTTSSIAAIAKLRSRSVDFVLVEVPGEHQRHRDLHHLRGLEAVTPTLQPAPRAVDDVAEQRHRRRAARGRAHRPAPRGASASAAGSAPRIHIAASATPRLPSWRGDARRRCS